MINTTPQLIVLKDHIKVSWNNNKIYINFISLLDGKSTKEFTIEIDEIEEELNIIKQSRSITDYIEYQPIVSNNIILK